MNRELGGSQSASFGEDRIFLFPADTEASYPRMYTAERSVYSYCTIPALLKDVGLKIITNPCENRPLKPTRLFL
jgi:hypothetical protein